MLMPWGNQYCRVAAKTKCMQIHPTAIVPIKETAVTLTLKMSAFYTLLACCFVRILKYL
jgi:hypothetical protein